MSSQKSAGNIIANIFHRYLVQAMSAMALGLFSSLIIGLIISQLSQISYLSWLAPFTEIIGAKSPVVGGAIGAAVAWGLKAKPLVVFSSVTTGAFGYMVGGPVGSFIAAVFGAEIAGIVAGKTKIDIVLTPLVTIVSGCFAGQFAGPYIQSIMLALGDIINSATEMSPFPMGIIIAVVVGMALTAPISSAALCIMMDISGLAAGAATVGCCAQMIGFAATSSKENGIGGFISQGLGTSMLQFGNIMRRPQIWIAPTLTAAILGPISTCLFHMENTAVGAGMGTSGLVGQFGTFAAMSKTTPSAILWISVALLHFILPIIITLAIDKMLRKLGWIKNGDMKLEVIK